MATDRAMLRTCAGLLVLLMCVTSAAAAEPAVLQDGVATQGTSAGRGTFTQYTFTVPDRKLIELTTQVSMGPKQAYAPFQVQILRGRQPLYVYQLDCGLENYLFFPVLDRGTYQIVVRGFFPDSSYTLKLRTIDAKITDQDKAAALAAIEKGTANLLSATPATTVESPKSAVAVEALVMDALASDRSRANDKTIEKDYLPWLKAQLHEVPNVQWNGANVWGFTRAGSPMYCHAIATLALAEMAPHSDAAKEMAEKCANFLLAAQLTDRRPAAWRAIAPKDPSFGGWRYVPNANDADLSVTGWCVIALNACAAADIQPDGMREALKDAVGFVKNTASRDGFGYQLHGAGGTAAIRDAIGSLVYSLYGERGSEIDAASAFLDRHLFAGTQADDPQDYPLYFAYYATRLNYLRGSMAWEAWRLSAIRQLVKLQRPDGSWPTERSETETGPQRYSTALSVLILRMCLNDEPTYMTQEVKGF